ncbi:MAG: hypothetical protein ACK5ML_06760 [Lachnospiraceae bacterium]
MGKVAGAAAGIGVRIIIRIALIALVVLAVLGYKFYTGESNAGDVSQEMIDKFNSGAGISYVETYTKEDSAGVLTYERDANGNIMISDLGKYTNEDYSFDTVDYKVDGVYYAFIDGQTLEYGSAELNAYEGYEGYDIETFFNDELAYIQDILSHYTTELYDNNIDSNFKREGDNFVATGTYEGGGEYRVELAQDGSSLNIVDDECTIKVEFTEDAVTLP